MSTPKLQPVSETGFVFFCGPHMEGGEKIKAAGFLINCSTIRE